MNDSDRLEIAEAALRRIVDDCPKCGGYGRAVNSVDGKRCDRCELAREALRDMGRVVV